MEKSAVKPRYNIERMFYIAAIGCAWRGWLNAAACAWGNRRDDVAKDEPRKCGGKTHAQVKRRADAHAMRTRLPFVSIGLSLWFWGALGVIRQKNGGDWQLPTPTSAVYFFRKSLLVSNIYAPQNHHRALGLHLCIALSSLCVKHKQQTCIFWLTIQIFYIARPSKTIAIPPLSIQHRTRRKHLL